LAAWVAHALLNDLVRPQQNRLRDREAERLGGLEVKSEVQQHRPLDRKVRGLCPLEDLVNVARCTAEQIDDIWAFAVFKLMTSSNFVGCSPGRSPGFVPLRILST
jgi:hypothetical protein